MLQLGNHQFWRIICHTWRTALSFPCYFTLCSLWSAGFGLFVMFCRSLLIICTAAISTTITFLSVFIEISDVWWPLTSFYFEIWRFKKSSASKERRSWTTQHSSRCGLLQLRFWRWILWSWLWWRSHVEPNPTDVLTLPRKFTPFYCRRFETSCTTMALEPSWVDTCY